MHFLIFDFGRTSAPERALSSLSIPSHRSVAILGDTSIVSTGHDVVGVGMRYANTRHGRREMQGVGSTIR
eukprot:1182712-Rhodomonas_salina.1